MDVSSIQQDTILENSSSPNQYASEQKHDFVPNGIGLPPEELKIGIAQDVQKASSEVRMEESVSTTVAQLRSPEDSARNVSREQLPQHTTLCSLEPNELQTENSNPKQFMLDPNREFCTEIVNNEQLQENQVMANENVNDEPVKYQKSESNHLYIEQKETLLEEVTLNSCLEPLFAPEDDLTKKCNHDQLGLPQCVAATDSKDVQSGLQSGYISNNPCLEQVGPAQESTVKSQSQLGQKEKRTRGRPRKEKNSLTQNSCLESVIVPEDDLTKNCSHDQLGLPLCVAATDSKDIQSGLQSDYVSNNPCIEHVGPAQESAVKNQSQLGHKEKRTRGRPRKEKNSLTSTAGNDTVLPNKRKDHQSSSVGSSRFLRSRSQEKSKVPELSNTAAEEGADKEKKRKKRKKRMGKSQVNEFSRIRTHLRYLLHRIKYEQNFIDAYSGEGWKGQSLEKIKPEKELQRAKSEIFRRKLKIRDLFQRLDLACAEGRLPEALFDSRGEIDSEDIFCAKCGSKDVTLNNDIILCDGTCERGFHQFCLEPPLLKEHIPPGDEGWLCPGCDCKLDCIAVLNDSQGTNISVSDSWEKVFPEEAAAAASGRKLDDNTGLPSDDSEDDDYDPDGPELDEEVQGDETSSDGSDYYSASDDLGALPHKEQALGLPSDDSEDDDYDPSGLDPDQEIKEQSSSSDFTSDSEDFILAAADNKSSAEIEELVTSTLNDNNTNEERCEHNEMKRESLSSELSSPLESDAGKGVSVSLYPKRRVERLDYKKLHDEEYGNTSSDSSDEDYADAALPRRRHGSSGEEASVLPNLETPISRREKDACDDMELDQKESKYTKKRKNSKKLDVERTNSSGKGTRASYGEDVTQRLLQSFKENQYPKRAEKENLARELALTAQQVSKWFENARWSFRHSPQMAVRVAETANKGTPSQDSKKLTGPETEVVSEEATGLGAEVSPGMTECCSKDVKSDSVAEECNGQNSSTPRSRKRKAKFDNQVPEPNTSSETPTQRGEVQSSKTQEARKSSRIQSKSMKSTS